MENIYQINNLRLFTIFFLVSIVSMLGQNSYYMVYKIEGKPFMEVNDSIKSIEKGSLIDKHSTLTMAKEDIIYYLDTENQVYKFDQVGTFKYKDLKNVQPLSENSSFTKKMFSYVWNQFTKTDLKEKNKSGVVYRGDNIVLMRHPADSIKIFYPEIKFEWDEIKDKTKEYYFILKDVETNTISKIGLLENSLILFVNEGLIKSGKMYEWTITETKFPNYGKSTFYAFKILSSSEFDSLKNEIDVISKDLKLLGLNDNEIREAMCEDYKVCF